MPALLDRQFWDAWSSRGASDLRSRAQERLATLQSHQPEPLPDDTRRALRAWSLTRSRPFPAGPRCRVGPTARVGPARERAGPPVPRTRSCPSSLGWDRRGQELVSIRSWWACARSRTAPTLRCWATMRTSTRSGVRSAPSRSECPAADTTGSRWHRPIGFPPLPATRMAKHAAAVSQSRPSTTCAPLTNVDRGSRPSADTMRDQGPSCPACCPVRGVT